MNRSEAERDYSGVPTAELAVLYQEKTDCDYRTFAARIGMDEGDLKKIVVTQKYAFTGLTWADKIVMGLGENLSLLVHDDRLHIIPARGSLNAARRIIEDTLVLSATETMEEARLSIKDVIDQGLLPPTSVKEMQRRAEKLIALRGELALATPEQADRLRRESERSKERLARKRAEANGQGTAVAA